MANTIYIPHINPLKLIQQGTTQDASFNFKHLDSAFFEDQILDFQQKNFYLQKWQTSDTIYIQFASSFGPFDCRIVDCQDNVIASGTVTQITTTYYAAPMYAYIAVLPLTTVPEGTYRYQLLVGSGTTKVLFESRNIHIKQVHKNTLCLKYSNSVNDFGAIFENGESFIFRVDAILKDFSPGANTTVFEDEPANLVTLSSTHYRLFKISIGGAKGVPDWVIDVMNRIYGCDKVLHDGLAFTKNEGAKFEPNGENNSALRGWSLEVRESKARDGITVENSLQQNEMVNIIYIIDGGTSMFGTLNQATDTVIVKRD